MFCQYQILRVLPVEERTLEGRIFGGENVTRKPVTKKLILNFEGRAPFNYEDKEKRETLNTKKKLHIVN